MRWENSRIGMRSGDSMGSNMPRNWPSQGIINMAFKELMYCHSMRKHFFVTRESNRSVLVRKDKIWDGDGLIIEDKRGHRYQREVTLDTETHFYFQII